jgi:hypothetical protein
MDAKTLIALLLCLALAGCILPQNNPWAGFETGAGTTNFNACGTMSATGEVYNQTADISATTNCIVITAENVTIRGNGFTITQTATANANYTGISSNSSKTIIANLTLKNFQTGISLSSTASNATLNNLVVKDAKGLNGANGAAGTDGSCGYTGTYVTIISTATSGSPGTNGTPVFGMIVNSSGNSFSNITFQNISSGTGGNGGNGGNGGSCSWGYCSYSCVGQGGDGGAAGTSPAIQSIIFTSSENNTLANITVTSFTRGLAGSVGALGCGGGGADYGYCHLSGGTNGVAGAAGNNSTIFALLMNNGGKSSFTQYSALNLNYSQNNSYGVYLNGSSSNKFFICNNTADFRSNASQNISSYENVGYWPTVTSNGSDATSFASTTIYSGAPFSYWYNSTLRPTAPIIVSSRISPNGTTTSNNTLMGYCNATDANPDNVNYTYKVYKNGTLFSSGTTAFFTQGVEVNVANVTTTINFTHLSNWTLECMASDIGGLNTSKLNSSNTTFNATAQYTSPTPLNDSLVDGSIIVNVTAWGITPTSCNLTLGNGSMLTMTVSGQNCNTSITFGNGNFNFTVNVSGGGLLLQPGLRYVHTLFVNASYNTGISTLSFKPIHAWAQNVEPVNQTSTKPVYNITNTQNFTAQVVGKISSNITGFNFKCSPTYNPLTAIPFTDAYANLTTLTAFGNGGLFCWADFNNPNPRSTSFNISINGNRY